MIFKEIRDLRIDCNINSTENAKLDMMKQLSSNIFSSLRAFHNGVFKDVKLLLQGYLPSESLTAAVFLALKNSFTHPTPTFSCLAR
jgi:hypothetical protein